MDPVRVLSCACFLPKEEARLNVFVPEALSSLTLDVNVSS